MNLFKPWPDLSSFFPAFNSNLLANLFSYLSGKKIIYSGILLLSQLTPLQMRIDEDEVGASTRGVNILPVNGPGWTLDGPSRDATIQKLQSGKMLRAFRVKSCSLVASALAFSASQ